MKAKAEKKERERGGGRGPVADVREIRRQMKLPVLVDFFFGFGAEAEADHGASLVWLPLNLTEFK